MRKYLGTITLTVVASLAILFWIFHLHKTSREKVLSQFNNYQLLATQQIALSIERYFLARSQDLALLTHVAARQVFDRNEMTQAIRANFNRLQISHIHEVSLLNEQGSVLYSTTAGAERENYSQANFFVWARNPGNKGKIRMFWEKMEGPHMAVTPGSPTRPHVEIFLVTPLYRESTAGGQQQLGGEFAGVFLFAVDLEKTLAERWPLHNPATKDHKLWIIERNGTLLLHSEHPEMVMRNIRIRDKTCNECHPSFSHLESILRQREGTIEYQINGQSRKIAAFARMSFEGTSLIIVMNAPLDEVTAFQRENLKETIYLLGAVMFLLSFSFFITYRNYRLKALGELEVKRLRDNKELAEKLRKTLGGTIQVISRAVEMRDPYTAGHNRRTADLARAIASEMGLSADRKDFVRMTGAIHDIGKISVPAEILSKTTSLTDLEYCLIKEHAQAGYDILKDIEFPWPVAEVILQHHERMDGSGYPQGLIGEDILLEARILAVADVVESMVSHRPYRHALGIDSALAELAANRGSLYDGKVVDSCLQLFQEKNYKMVD